MKEPLVWTPELDRWMPFFGNNHKEVPNKGLVYGGEVRFTKHIGKPLSDRLWDDLVHRMQVRCIRIYTENNGSEWLDGRDRAHIYLDESGNVREIAVSFPMFPFIRKEEPKPCPDCGFHHTGGTCMDS